MKSDNANGETASGFAEDWPAGDFGRSAWTRKRSTKRGSDEDKERNFRRGCRLERPVHRLSLSLSDSLSTYLTNDLLAARGNSEITATTLKATGQPRVGIQGIFREKTDASSIRC